VPPAEHLLPGHPLRQGWQAGRAAFGSRTLRAGRAVQQWLGLRLAAWAQGQAFEAVEVTPNYLAQIDSRRCPITRTALGDAAGEGGEAAVIERINHRAGYAAGNLVGLSPLARQAKGGKRWDEARLAAVLAEARQADGAGPVEGLASAEWARLATLMSFATPLPHELAATLPLRVLPPNRVRLINPIQGLQALITLQLTHSGFAVRIAQLVNLLPGMELRRDFHLFFHSLLPREVYATGIRNSVGLEFNPKDKTLWFTDNQTDGMGDDIPAGEINRATKPGQFFGYPWKQGRTRMTDEGYDKDALPANITDPQVYMDAHAADLGLVFYTAKAFPAKYQGGLFSAQHGSWNRTKPVGARIMFTSMKADGTADKTEVFAEGWLDNETGIYRGRPVDVAVAKDGSLLISDDFAGAIYRVTYAP